jgi:hypothetical protein
MYYKFRPSILGTNSQNLIKPPRMAQQPPSRPLPPHYRRFTITLRQTTFSRDFSGQVISSTQKPLSENTQQPKETDINAPGGIRTHNPSKRVAAAYALHRAAIGIGPKSNSTE